MTRVPEWIAQRRSIRSFSPEPVDADLLDTCVAAALLLLLLQRQLREGGVGYRVVLDAARRRAEGRPQLGVLVEDLLEHECGDRDGSRHELGPRLGRDVPTVVDRDEHDGVGGGDVVDDRGGRP